MKKILIADDEAILRMLISDSLEDLDIILEEAEDGEIALSKIKNNDYDLVILDYMMPKLTGIDVLDNLSEEKKSTMDIMMVTAKTQESDQKIIREKGANYFMSKPFSPIELYEIVEGILNE